MTKILLDTQIFTRQKFGGISRYFIELYSVFSRNEQLNIDFPILYTSNLYFKETHFYESGFQKKYSFLIKYSKILRPFLPRKLERKGTKKVIELLKRQEFDVFIPTYYDPYFLPHIKTKPFVLTVHDMIHELYPQYFSNEPETIQNKKVLIENATKIIAISENTRKDLIRIYPQIDPGKIEVIYLAHTVKNGPLKELDVPERYILFVGQRSAYKNFHFFLKAVSSLIHEYTDLFVFCAGGNSFTEEELALIKELNISDRVLQKNFEDSELSSYYSKALCFVFPSEYEGFGIPVLEAMAAACPVVLTKASSFPEVAGDAGIYFELNNCEDLTNKIDELLNDATLRQVYKTKGITQASKFSWEKTAEETFKVYQQAIKSSYNG